MKNNGKMIGGAFLLGGAIGAAVALLYAPKSGKETRKDISRAARGIKNNTVDLIDDTIDDVNEFASNLKEKAANVVEQGVELSEKAKKEIMKTLEQGQRSIEKQRKRLTDALGF